MTDRREQILKAALPLFLAKGYSGTTIADIRQASGATTGSLYHFFAGKPGIAIALWREANAEWSQRNDAAGPSPTPEDSLKASVRGLLHWALANRALFLFYEDLRIRAHSDPDLAPITGDIDQAHSRAAALYREWIARGAVRDLPWPVASALMVGPSYDYLRKCRDGDDTARAIDLLAEAAWQAVRQPPSGG